MSGRLARSGKDACPVFARQTGYGAFSLGSTTVESAVHYVREQPERHGAGTVWAQWEETDQDAPEPDSRPARSGVTPLRGANGPAGQTAQGTTAGGWHPDHGIHIPD